MRMLFAGLAASAAVDLLSLLQPEKHALDTLLSAQGQGTQRKKRSMSVLLDLMQSSQDGKVKKSDFDAAAGESNSEASEVFDRIDQNHDSSVNLNELSAFLDTYRRNSEAGTQGRALAVIA
jgi:hypothetical protein